MKTCCICGKTISQFDCKLIEVDDIKHCYCKECWYRNTDMAYGKTWNW